MDNYIEYTEFEKNLSKKDLYLQVALLLDSY